MRSSVKYTKIREYYNSTEFQYNSRVENINIACKIEYINFEGRIDKKSFQIMINETRPKNLIIVDVSLKKFERIKEFVSQNKLNVNVGD